jgi:hypothetical protein
LLKGHLDPTRYGVQGPMFEFALAAVGLVVRDLFVAAQLVSLAGMVAMLVSWRALFARWLGHAGGRLAVALLAVNLWAWRFAWSATTDALGAAGCRRSRCGSWSAGPRVARPTCVARASRACSPGSRS